MSADRDASRLHVPVLLNECLDMLAPAIETPGAVLIDATLGMGGHTEAALKRFPQLTVFGIDRDPAAIELASAGLRPLALGSEHSIRLTTTWLKLPMKRLVQWSMAFSWTSAFLLFSLTKKNVASRIRTTHLSTCE